jgi:acetyl-CoA synthetase
MLLPAQSYEEACRTFRWRIPSHYNQAFDLCDRHTLGGADGHRTALIVETGDGKPAERYSFITLRRLASRLCAVLSALGVGPGDRVAVSLAQSLEAAVCLLAVPRMGAVAVPIPVSWDGDAVIGILDRSRPKAAILAGARAHDAAASVAAPHVLAVGGLPVGAGSGGGVLDFWAALERADDGVSAALTKADDPAALIHCGLGLLPGQSVLHAHRAVLGNLPAVEYALDFFAKAGDVMWTSWDWMSFEGAYWALFPAWHHGVPVMAAPAFQPNGGLDWMAGNGVRVAVLPPDHLAALAEAAAKRSHVLPRALATGPDPLPPQLAELVQMVFGVPANEIWGVAATGALAANNPKITECRAGSPGRMLPGICVEAASLATGKLLPADTPGILAASPNLAGQCLDGPHGRFGPTGWPGTGWTGLRDLDGYVWPDPRPGVVMPTPEPVRPAKVDAPPIRLDGISPDDRW